MGWRPDVTVKSWGDLRSGDGGRRADPTHILLLEDDGPTASLITTVIEEDLSIPVKVAGDGLTALRMVQAAMPLAIMVDLMVPALDGQAFMQEVRERHGSLVPLIVVSALPAGEVRAAASRAQARYLLKPFEIQDLVASVADAIAPWFEAAVDDRPQCGKLESVSRSLRSDADLLVERSWRVLARAHDSAGRAEALTRLQRTFGRSLW